MQGSFKYNIGKLLKGTAVIALAMPLLSVSPVFATESVKEDQLINPSHEQLMHYSFNMSMDELNAETKKTCSDSHVSVVEKIPEKEGVKAISDVTVEKCVTYAGEKRNITFHFKNGELFYTIINIGAASGGKIAEEEGATGIEKLDAVLEVFNKDAHYKPVRQTPAAMRKAFNAGEDGANVIKFYFENTITGNLIKLSLARDLSTDKAEMKGYKVELKYGGPKASAKRKGIWAKEATK